jgi:hypothetical protein
MWQQLSKRAIRSRPVSVALMALALLAVPLAAVGGPASNAGAARGTQAAAAAAQKRAGIGTAAALAAPNCDAKLGRIKMPFVYAPPCTVPWPAGSNNGDATYQGVTAKTITIVGVGGSVADVDTNRSEVELAWKDVFAVYSHEFQMWGRTVKFIWEDFGANSTPDEVLQTAMATTIIDLKPFAVVEVGGGTTLNDALAEAKIPTFTDNTSSISDTSKLAPYLWYANSPGPSDQNIAMSAQFIAAQLMGKPAKWAGEADLQSKKRVFGLVYDTGISNPTFFNQYFTKYHVKLANEIAITPGPTATRQVPTVLAKLKADGVTTVIDATDIETNVYLTNGAASQLYFPEWLSTGTQAMDLTVGTRYFNAKEWAHAFGFGEFPPVPTADYWWNTLMDWYYGTNQPSFRLSKTPPNYNTVMQQSLSLFLGIDLAGPDLNPFTLRDGLFAYPPSGGAACGCITTIQMSFGGHGVLPGYANYSMENDDVMEWWDPTLVGQDPTTGAIAPGLWLYMNGGKRYTFGKFPTTAQSFFSKAATVNVNTVKTLPKNDQPPTYPCTGCPSASPA